MPVVTGTLTDIGMRTLQGVLPIISFTPTASTAGDGRLFATKPVATTPDALGRFSVVLASTDVMPPSVHYRVSISWLESEGGYTAVDYPELQVRVPLEGGRISDLIGLSGSSALFVAWQEEEPNPWPVGLVWVQTSTGDIRKKTA